MAWRSVSAAAASAISFTDVPADRYVTIVEGKGIAR
jgi:hypothetical protein